ncbi:3'(2'),5'-bisphosphate nucleotidase CysQ [Pelagibacteraceae bacterium]|nr:3'(2'),5'-bisphosphate nucleotidase CysQ [Pelagibacteraceae bacterium]
MNNSDLKNISEGLLATFIKAGEIAKKISERGLKITIKHDKSPVTDGDIEVDKCLRQKIAELTPNIPIISEETVNLNIENKNKTFWLIDPIDGTKDYIKKRDEYTLNAALISNLKPALGIVHAPAKNRLFFSYGKGNAFEINKGERKILNCKKKIGKEIIALANSDETPSEILNIYKKYRVSKIIKMSSSLKFCVIAAGEADIYAAKARAFEWDIAAGHAILEHAGGIVQTHEGKEFTYGKKDYRNLPIIVQREKF